MIDLEAASQRLLDGQADRAPVLRELRRRAQARRRRRRAAGSVAVVVVAAAMTGVLLNVGGRGGRLSVVTPPNQTGGARLALSSPEALAIAPDGDLLIDNLGTNQILARTAGGALRLVAGNGRAGYSGDGGPATRATLDHPQGIAASSDGVIYIADTTDNRVRAISPSGIITTVAGDGRVHGTTTGNAVRASVAQPESLAVGGSGQLYITDNAGLQVLAHGALTTLIAAGPGAIKVSGRSTAWFPDQIAVSSTGDLYVTDSSPKLVTEFTSAGHFIKTWGAYTSQLAAGQSGSVFVADYGHLSLDQISTGRLRTVLAFHLNSLTGVEGVFRPSGVAVSSDGTVYLDTDGVNGGASAPALLEVRPGHTPQLLDSAEVASTSASPTTMLAQGVNAKNRVMVTASGPDHIRLRLWVSAGAGDPFCEFVDPSKPGLPVALDESPLLARACQHPDEVPADGGIAGSLWIAPDHRQWDLLFGRAAGARRVRLHWRSYTTTVPVRRGWWVGAMPDANNGEVTGTPILPSGALGKPFIA